MNILTMNIHNKFVPHLSAVRRTLLTAAVLVSLGGCAIHTDIPPGTPVSTVLQTNGKPTLECALPDGGKRLIWTQQPMAETAWGVNVNAQGQTGQFEQLLTDQNFQKLSQGQWTADMVRCQFGPPADIDQVGLPSVRQYVWSYRYIQGGAWHSLMYVYMGRDGQMVTHFNPGPDPLFESGGRDRR